MLPWQCVLITAGPIDHGYQNVLKKTAFSLVRNGQLILPSFSKESDEIIPVE